MPGCISFTKTEERLEKCTIIKASGELDLNHLEPFGGEEFKDKKKRSYIALTAASLDAIFTEPLRRGKYPLLLTDAEADNCFSIYNASLIAQIVRFRNNRVAIK